MKLKPSRYKIEYMIKFIKTINAKNISLSEMNSETVNKYYDYQRVVALLIKNSVLAKQLELFYEQTLI
jgi:hypothetical protein